MKTPGRWASAGLALTACLLGLSAAREARSLPLPRDYGLISVSITGFGGGRVASDQSGRTLQGGRVRINCSKRSTGLSARRTARSSRGRARPSSPAPAADAHGGARGHLVALGRWTAAHPASLETCDRGRSCELLASNFAHAHFLLRSVRVAVVNTNKAAGIVDDRAARRDPLRPRRRPLCRLRPLQRTGRAQRAGGLPRIQ
jgi:hypothetical protein